MKCTIGGMSWLYCIVQYTSVYGILHEQYTLHYAVYDAINLLRLGSVHVHRVPCKLQCMVYCMCTDCKLHYTASIMHFGLGYIAFGIKIPTNLPFERVFIMCTYCTYIF